MGWVIVLVLMQAEFVFDFVAVGLATVVAFVLGFLWYSPAVLGKPWMKAIGMEPDFQPSGAEMSKNIILQVLGTVFMAYVFFTVVQAFTADTWLHDDDTLTIGNAFVGVFFMWLGFIVPVTLTKVTWERNPMSLFFIDASYYLVSLSAQVLIFWWRLS